MNILVLLKQVPDTTEMQIDKETGTLIRAGVPTITNPDDLAGLEAALRLKDSMGAKVTCITMGPPQAKNMMRELYAMGADEAIVLSDMKFSGADTWATSNTLAALIKTLEFDLIIAGRQAIDGDTAQVGPQTAEKLGLPQITYVDDIVAVKDGKIVVKKALESTYELVESPLPCVITTLSTLAAPRYMHVKGISHAYERDIKIMTFDDIQIDQSIIGLKGSPTKVKKTFTKEVHKNSDILHLDGKAAARKVFDIMVDFKFIGK